jgi:Domain of unknown function (DUF1835)
MLHITNGDETVARMRDGGLSGSYLPWQDILHEGPVPQTDTLDQLSNIRSGYLASAGYGTELRIRDQFRARDQQLVRTKDEDEIVLWFEHDLHDQLQLLQVLDWLGRHRSPARISLIVVGAYPGIARFIGLGQLTPSQLVGLLDARVPATPTHFETARHAWAAFRKSTPNSWSELLRQETLPLEFLRSAALRMLEELPSSRNGLSRNERAALNVIVDGAGSPREIFAGAQKLEASPFLGDWSFWRLLARLAAPPEPLLQIEGGARFFYPPQKADGPEFEAQHFALTDRGRDVLENRTDAVRLKSIDRWFGGTHLEPGSVWRWDEDEQKLVAPGDSE